MIARGSISAGDVVTFCEDNVRVRVEVLKVKDDDGTRAFRMKALERGNRHALAKDCIEEGQEFEVTVALKFIDSVYVAWHCEEDLKT